MCLRRVPEKYITGAMAPVGAALDRAALGAFLDTEGAFDRTSFDTIKQAAAKHGIEPAICRWISASQSAGGCTLASAVGPGRRRRPVET
jgi:hypothetical protein